MANRTDPTAISVKGQNPQYLIDAIVRNKIYANLYWKESLTGLTAESLVDEAIKLEYIGGTYGGYQKPTKFIVLILKMLQIQPDKDIILEFIHNKDYKYASALAMFYFRLVGLQEDIYLELEKLLTDYRKLRYRNQDGSYSIMYMDEFADALLQKEIIFNINLPHIQKRLILEEQNRLKPRISLLEQELEEELKYQKEELEKQELKNQGQQDLNNNNNQDTVKNSTDLQKRFQSRSRSRSRSHKNKKKKEKKDKKQNNWEKINKISKKHKKKEKYKSNSRSRSRSNQKEHKKQQSVNDQKIEKDSIEYWNKIRSEIGANLIPGQK